MSYSTQLLYEPLRSANTASASTNLVLGTPLAHPASLIKMVNLSDKDLIVAIDSFGDVDICPAGGFWLYDVTTNSAHTNHIFSPQGRQYIIRTTDAAPGTGLVYLVTQYIRSN